MKLTKTEKVLRHLKKGKTITQAQAIDLYGSYRLSAIIHVLRHERGVNIKSIAMYSKPDENGHVSTFCKYKLIK